jgi:NitT/TauT family transport system ATP-binding protein
MIALDGITKSYGEKRVLSGVTLVVPAGEVTALTGRSGSGKTTLARILLGLERPDGGRVECPRSIRRAAVFQEDRLIEHMSALDNLRLVGCRRARPARTLRRWVWRRTGTPAPFGSAAACAAAWRWPGRWRQRRI